MLRACTRQRLPAFLALPAAAQRRGKADAKASFDSPFAQQDTTKIPNFKNYMSKRGETSNKVFQYFMAGSMGALAAAGAKATVQGWWTTSSIVVIDSSLFDRFPC
jgi:ubiquinol-cytochrome c reductase iron-sulfur subunit